RRWRCCRSLGVRIGATRRTERTTRAPSLSRRRWVAPSVAVEGCPGQGPQAEEMQQMVGERVEQEPKDVGAEGLTLEPIGGAVSLLADARTHCTGCRCTRSALGVRSP